MSPWRRIWTVATFEYLSTVTRPGYLITTLGMPIFLGLYGAIVTLPTIYSQRASREIPVFGVVDTGDVLGLHGDETVTRTQILFRPIAAEPDARVALIRSQLVGYIVVSPDYVGSGALDLYAGNSIRVAGADTREAVADLLRRHLLAGRLDDPSAARIAAPLAGVRRLTVTRNGEISADGTAATVVRVVVPLLFTVLFVVSVMMTSGYLIQGTATEKENKVVDVLLASANPDEILGGKLLGLGGAGLLQIVVWLSLMLAAGIGVLPFALSARIDIPWAAAGFALMLFPLAFLFFGSLMLGTGSLGSSMRESQQLAVTWSLVAALPLIMLAPMLRDPHGTVARILTWLPTSAAPVVVLRASLDPESLAWWEIGGTSVLLVAATWIAIKIGARLFRVGLMSSGARPSIREVLRQARLAD